MCEYRDSHEHNIIYLANQPIHHVTSGGSIKRQARKARQRMYIKEKGPNERVFHLGNKQANRRLAQCNIG